MPYLCPQVRVAREARCSEVSEISFARRFESCMVRCGHKLFSAALCTNDHQQRCVLLCSVCKEVRVRNDTQLISGRAAVRQPPLHDKYVTWLQLDSGWSLFKVFGHSWWHFIIDLIW